MKWLHRLCAARARSQGYTARRRVVPALEALEDRRLLSVATPNYVAVHTAGATPNASSSPYGFFPSQIRHAYGIDAIRFGSVVGDGAGQTIAIVDAFDDPTIASDLHVFDVQLGLPDPPSFRKVDEFGGTNLPGTDPVGPGGLNWEGEEALDVEWAHAVAPGANIILVEATSATFDDLVAKGLNWARQQPGVSAVSMSFGVDGGFADETSLSSYFTTPNGHGGVTFVASSGDNGAPGGFPAYSPNVLAVGGTTLTLSGSSYGAETAWGGSGGGLSPFEGRPSFQDGVASVVGGARGIPDVAFDADPGSGVAVYDSYNGGAAPWYQFGGTSVAAPCWAALIAVANQGRAVHGLGSLDGASQTLPLLYSLSANDFHDVTTGANGGYSAGAGYDLVTGRGTPVANLLVADLAGTPATPIGAATSTFTVAEFPGSGVWRHSQNGWQQLTAVDATQLAVDAHGDVAAELPGSGVWRYRDSSGWQQLTTADVSQLAMDARGDVVVEIPGHGVWRYEDTTTWRWLTPVDASHLAIAGNGIVAVELPGFGVWRFEDAGAWQRLTTADASQLALDSTGAVAITIPGSGVWRYTDAASWAWLSTADASQVALDANGNVTVEIVGYGVWRYLDGSGWNHLTTVDASQLVVDSNGDIAVELPGYGIWLYQDGLGWGRLNATDASQIGQGA